MTPKILEKPQDLWATNGLVRVQLDVSRQAPSPGRNGHGSNHRDFAGMPGAVHQLRGLSDGGPCPLHVRSQQQSAFIDEDNMGLVLPRLFLMRDQFRATQRLTASWFRSRARNCGFCQLNPKSRSKSER